MWPQLRLSFAVASAIEAGHGQFENYRRARAKRRNPNLWRKEFGPKAYGGVLADARAIDADEYAESGRYALLESVARESRRRSLLAKRGLRMSAQCGRAHLYYRTI